MNDLLSRIGDALTSLPGVRLFLGLVDPRLRPVIAALLVVGIAYVLSRATHYFSLRQARRVLSSDDFSGRRPVIPDREAETLSRTTPSETTIERLASSGTAFYWRPLVAAVGAAAVVAVVLVAANRGKGLLPLAVIESTGTNAEPDTSFRFEDAGWRMDRDDCVATIRVTSVGRAPRRLSLSVTDVRGGVIGRAAVWSPTVISGSMVDFRFARLDCRRVNEWQMQGEFGQN